jgi:serine/threonine-protein kinase
VLGVSLLALGLLGVFAWALLGGRTNVPKLDGLPVEQARQAAADAGFSMQVEEQPSEDAAAGLVIRQEPGADGRARRGATIHAVDSSGVSVPDLVGQQCAQARADVEARGWKVRPVRWRIANIEDFGKIVAQDPAAGSAAPGKSEITVQVAGPVRPC